MEELPSSELGTKKHWDETYTSELREFSDHGDVGEVWFGEESEQRIIDWLTEEWLPAWWAEQSAKRAEKAAKRAGLARKREEPAKEESSVKSSDSEKRISSSENSDSPKAKSQKTDSKGGNEQKETANIEKDETGSKNGNEQNGTAVIENDKIGSESCNEQNETAVTEKDTKEEETSKKKVELAVDDEIGLKHCSVLDLGTGNGHFLIQLAMVGFTQLFGIDYSASAVCLARAINTREGYDITFAQLDLVGPELPGHPLTRRRYSVCHDKGTYDAISLTPGTAKTDRERYLLNVSRLLEPDGVFVITSCNWTEDELLPQCQQYFSKLHTIPTPTFSFGGSTGSLVTTLVLQKISDNVR